ncbi:ketoacyl-ACP synthase III [Treponema primitia]|uniref:beta-ketoacyl-ACP synthase III n=1 Tax=Treponema primitia TaxID=88058 RepID=UPI00397FB1A3
MAFEIIATGKAIPSNRVSNDDLARRIDTNDEWIRSHSGIGARHFADESTASSDLALEASLQVLSMTAEKTGETLEELILSLDLILLGTVTPDYYGTPATACVVQAKLGAKNAAALDITAGCSGFIYGLEFAAGYLSLNPARTRALVIGSEILSRVTNWDDRSTCVLFGDGAGAVLIEQTGADAGKRGLIRTSLGADGTGAECIINRWGGSRQPYKKGEIVEFPSVLEMDGRAVYNFAVKAVTGTIEKLLTEQGITIDQVARIVPHQANARIVQAAAKRLGIPEEKFFLNIEEYANTSSASIPIALDELNRGGKIKTGDLIMTIGFGAGLTFGGNLIIW